MRTWTIIAVISLAGCASKAQQAKDRYRTAEKANDQQAACQVAGEVADAYLTAGDADKFREWRQTERLACIRARVDAMTSGRLNDR